MAKFTLLDMTQNILSRMSSDEVNSISDSPESLQVANIIKNKYFDIINRVDLPEHDQLVQLEPSLDATSPVLMYVPDGVSDLKWLKYFDSNVLDGVNPNNQAHGTNVNITSSGWSTTSVTSVTIGLGTKVFTVAAGLGIAPNNTFTATSGVNSMSGTVISYIGTTLTLNSTTISGSGTFATWTIVQTNVTTIAPGYCYVTILPTNQFIDMVNSFNPTESNVDSFTFSDTSNNFPGDFTFYYRNDRQPCYCTIISNLYVIFDSFDNTQDSTLQGAKTMAMGRIIPHWSMVDSFIPDLAEEQFQLLVNEATALAFYELKQQPHQLAMQESKRGWSNIQKDKAIINRPTYFNELANFGRRSGVYYGTRGFGNGYSKGMNPWQ